MLSEYRSALPVGLRWLPINQFHVGDLALLLGADRLLGSALSAQARTLDCALIVGDDLLI